MLVRERASVSSTGPRLPSREQSQGFAAARVDRHLWLVPDTPTRSVAPAAPQLQLTRRGRIVLGLGLIGLVILAVLTPVGFSMAGSDAAPLRVRYITVQPGQTLWEIAQESLPEQDPRDAVLRLQELNALVTADVWSGQRLAIPASGS